MKVIISAKGDTLDANFDKRFGRGEWFLVIDTETNSVLEAVKNPNLDAAHGVGIKTATFVLEKGVDAVITGSYGPKAYDVLKEGNLKLYLYSGDSVKDAIEKLNAGELEIFKG